MLVWSSFQRRLTWALLALLLSVIYVAPLAIILAASFAGQWNGVFPSKPTLDHFAAAFTGDSGAQLRASIITGIVASSCALIVGTWSALALRNLTRLPRRVLDLCFFVPSAVPSVSIGLGLLVAFSRPPLLLNGTISIVIVAHFVLISAFTYGSVSAGLARLSPDFEQVAESLGARPLYKLWHVTLPMLLPYLIAAFSLSFALSMGELGATVMVYPPGWSTIPVGIFALTDRGDVFDGAAMSIVLIIVTLIVLILLSRIPTKVTSR
jgi:2-aminoethylphosphonate transport system permease protein